MALHLVKLAAGASGVDELERRIRARIELSRSRGEGDIAEVLTRMIPRRREELLADGSLYWVIKGAVLIRQRIVGLTVRPCEDGVERCAIALDPALIPTEAQPRRAFQGWRYLKSSDAPRDLAAGSGVASAALRAELAELGLL